MKKIFLNYNYAGYFIPKYENCENKKYIKISLAFILAFTFILCLILNEKSTTFIKYK